MISNALRLHFRHTRICKHSNNLKSTRSTRTNERMARQCANNFALAWDVISRARTPNAIEYDYKMIKILQTIERGFHERMYIYIYIYIYILLGFFSKDCLKNCWRRCHSWETLLFHRRRRVNVTTREHGVKTERHLTSHNECVWGFVYANGLWGSWNIKHRL